MGRAITPSCASLAVSRVASECSVEGEDKINSIRLMVISAEGEKTHELIRNARSSSAHSERPGFERAAPTTSDPKFGHIIDTGYLTLAISRGLT